MLPWLSPPFWNTLKNFFSKKFLDLSLEYTLNSADHSENFDFFASLSNKECSPLAFEIRLNVTEKDCVICLDHAKRDFRG